MSEYLELISYKSWVFLNYSPDEGSCFLETVGNRSFQQNLFWLKLHLLAFILGLLLTE
jgi:hypothetical protein